MKLILILSCFTTPLSANFFGFENERKPPKHVNTTASPTPRNPSNVSLMFYSFFVSMDKSAGYALPFANKLCYMAKHSYPWLLDVVEKEVVRRNNQTNDIAPTFYKPKGIEQWMSHVDYLIYLDADLVGVSSYSFTSSKTQFL